MAKVETSEINEAGQTAQYLTFQMGGDEYGIHLLQIKEIIRYETLTRVPNMPPAVRGVINLRGIVVPVVDLGLLFGLPESPVTQRTCIIILELTQDRDRMLIGITADAVNQVYQLLPDQIEPPPSFGTRMRVDHIQGMGMIDKKFLPLLNIDRILSAEELLHGTKAMKGPTQEEISDHASSEAPARPRKKGKRH